MGVEGETAFDERIIVGLGAGGVWGCEETLELILSGKATPQCLQCLADNRLSL